MRRVGTGDASQGVLTTLPALQIFVQPSIHSHRALLAREIDSRSSAIAAAN
ncbi:MAG TPA: hypothetical protein VKQ11_09850 [Candidatus Sulfotelmatobacter sp.]|nr:hypothetical protein [Candidatus Sulfotelmatobacter sp.]